MIMISYLNKTFKKLCFFITISLLGGSVVFAISDSLALKLADISEDVSLLRQEVGHIRLELESKNREMDDLNRQVAEMKSLVESLEKSTKETKTKVDLVSETEKDFRKETVDQINKQFKTITQKTQESISALAKALEEKTQEKEPEIEFTDDYPKEGIVYTVKKGDTLSLVALKNNSRVKDIQNANRIKDPKDLRAGQTIFIPQKGN